MNSPFGASNHLGHQRPLIVFLLRLSPLVLCLLPHFWFIDRSLSAVVQGALVQRSPSSLRQNATVLKATDKIDEEKRAKFFSRVHSIPMQTEYAMELYQHWIDQALSGLLAAVANKKLKFLPRPAQDEFGECSGAAKTVPLHARCVSRLLHSGFDGRKIYAKAYAKSHRFDRYRMQKKAAIRESRRKAAARQRLKRLEWLRRRGPPAAEKWRKRDQKESFGSDFDRLRSYTEHRRERRHASIVKKNYYELHSPSQARLSPLGSMAKLMMKEVLRVKGKQQQDVKPWQQTIARLQKSSVRRKEIRQKLEVPDREGDMDLDQLKFRGLKHQMGLAGEDLPAVVEDPRRARALIARTRAAARGSGASPTDRLVELLRQGFALGYSMAGQNGTDFEEKTLRSLSPRFLSVMPEGGPTQNKTIDLLSPSLFSLHADGEGIEKLTSLPNLIKGFNTKDQQQWMDLIMEAAGVAEQAEHIEQELGVGGAENVLRGSWREKGMNRKKYEREIRAKDGTPLYFTKKNVSDAFGKFEERKCDVFERLELGLSKEQLREMNNTGYALLSTEQLDLIYGPKSPYNNSEALRRFVRMNASEIHTGLEKDVHALAELESFRIRQKDVMLSPILFTNFILTFSVNKPIILSPILFSPLILSPNVLGPMILSPWVFVPMILSPPVLAPTILSPFMFDPIILSPYVLSPVILSPGAFNPSVLNPFVLSPFILSPQAFTPVILSPLALSPFILNPKVGSPLILSPYVLTPSILSPQFLSAIILSPYALSPVICRSFWTGQFRWLPFL
uniref:Uncharacterized protein n=1 Tax=Globodera rostochiensis TaxID=31243 RepID=A0A914I061_GLORO